MAAKAVYREFRYTGNSCVFFFSFFFLFFFFGFCFFVIFGHYMVSRRSGRYLETFLEPVASLWSSTSPFWATATPFMPKTIKFHDFKMCTPLDLSTLFLKFEFLIRDMVIQMGSGRCILNVSISEGLGFRWSISHLTGIYGARCWVSITVGWQGVELA